ncbi:hypothetical protein [Paenibacillus daejeonensis]|uniref:hypothetical protein n=1 Tax=Paenibacillus daejeonensis TaxID=135193 RepID=UPI0012FBB40C|nr:hypothetical protein [Paenibacillus daejeonensis]
MDNEVIETIVSDKITYREMLDDSKAGRIIEKIKCGSRVLVLKYGTDVGMKKEVQTYQQIGTLKLSIPSVIYCEQIDSLYLLVLEWIDGRYPDFQDNKDIQNYFYSLGRFAVETSFLNNNYFDFDTDELIHMTELKTLLQDQEELIKNHVGTFSYDMMQQLVAHKDNIFQCIMKIPKALDPGDISLHNAKIHGDSGKVVFFDFESAVIRPLSMFFEHFAEAYESIPSSETGILLSQQTFFQAWNTYAIIQISWYDFRQSITAAMLNYKAGNYIYWIRKIMTDKEHNETILWLKNDVQILEKLLLKLCDEEGDGCVKSD